MRRWRDRPDVVVVFFLVERRARRRHTAQPHRRGRIGGREGRRRGGDGGGGRLPWGRITTIAMAIAKMNDDAIVIVSSRRWWTTPPKIQLHWSRKCDNQHSRQQSRGGRMGWEGWRWEKERRWWRWRCDAPSRAGGGRGEDDYDGDNDDRGIVRGLVSVIARLCHNDVDGTMEPRGGDARGRGRRRRVTRHFAGR